MRFVTPILPILGYICWALCFLGLGLLLSRFLSGSERCPSCKTRAVRTWWKPETPSGATPHFYRC